MNNSSIWNKYLKVNNNKNKINNLKTDILIIGGGITGVTTAYFLKDKNYKITLIDKGVIGGGVTSKTTAKISYLQQNIYTKLINYHGLTVSKEYFDSQIEAINLITKIIKDNNIECDLKKSPSILYTEIENNRQKVIKERKILENWNVSTKTVESNKILYGFSVDNTYTFNPIKYLNSLKETIENKVSIYENTKVISMSKSRDYYQINTSNGLILSKKVVIACHYPFFIFPNLFPLKTYIEREYVNATKVDNPKEYNAINIEKNINSIRYYENYLIYGSNNHKLTSRINYNKNYQKSIEDLKKYFNIKPKYTWMNQDIMSHDKLPIIGLLKDDLYISTAYSKWGMTNGTIGAKIISDLIQNNKSKYQRLFNPKRINIPLIFNSFLGIFNYLKVYIESPFHINNPKYIKIDNFIYGVYTDNNKNEHKIKLICPHMKCHLVFNKEELTWDCPCHGSRFDIDGNLIEGPATKNINVNK